MTVDDTSLQGRRVEAASALTSSIARHCAAEVLPTAIRTFSLVWTVDRYSLL